MKTILIALLTLAVLWLAKDQFKERVEGYVYHGKFEYGCTVRPDEHGKWFILYNATHTSEGCKEVVQFKDKIQVKLSNCYDSIITAYAVADETFASQGIHSGLRMGLCEWTFQLYDKDNNLVDPATTYKSGNNIWLWSRGID